MQSHLNEAKILTHLGDLVIMSVNVLILIYLKEECTIKAGIGQSLETEKHLGTVYERGNLYH
jgi:hypothetical protein